MAHSALSSSHLASQKGSSVQFDISSQEASTFLQPYRFRSIDGPTSLVRFTDSGGGYRSALGKLDEEGRAYRSYWMYASEIEELLDDVAGPGPYGCKIVKEVSSRWAICDDWGNLERVWVLNIPAGKHVDGYCGYAKFQPKISAAAQERTGRTTKNSYPGGSVQFLLGLSDEHRRWICGPRSTMTLSKRRLRELSGA